MVGARGLIELLLGVSVLMRVAQSTALLLRMMGRVGMLLENAVIVRRHVSCHDLEFSIMWPCWFLINESEDMERQKKSLERRSSLIGIRSLTTDYATTFSQCFV